MSKKILDQFNLSGKKAMVVGGAGDLGVAMAEALVEAGTELVIIDLDDKVFGNCYKSRCKRQGTD